MFSEGHVNDVAYNAYRLGVLDVMLSQDVVNALNPPGIIVASLEGEQRFRVSLLETYGLKLASLGRVVSE